MVVGKSSIVALLGLTAVGGGIVAYSVLAGEPQRDQAAKPSEGNKTATELPPRLKEQLARTQVEQTQRDLAQLHSDMRKARTELAFWEARDKKIASLTIPDSAVDERLSQDPSVLRLINKINEVNSNIAEVMSVSALGKNDAGIKELQDQVTSNETNLPALRELLKPQ